LSFKAPLVLLLFLSTVSAFGEPEGLILDIKPEIDGVSYIHRTGYPPIPVLSILLEVERNPQIELLSSDEVERPYPSTFKQGAPYPHSPFRKGLYGSFRGRRILQIQILPLRFDPSRGKITVFRRIKLLVKGEAKVLKGPYIDTVEGPGKLAGAPKLSGEVFYPTELAREYEADYLMIVPRTLIGSETVKKLAEWRAAYDGFTVAVVNAFYIYSQFGDGYPSPKWIRSFLKYAYYNWRARSIADGRIGYVLLVGDVELIPTYRREYSPDGDMASDNYLARVDGDDPVPDLAIGRFPVKTEGELKWIVDKTINYESNSVKGDWANRALIVTGSVEELYDIAEEAADRMLKPAGFDVKWVKSWKGIVFEINRGCLIVEYAGHGWEDGWEQFKTSSISALNNKGMYPVISSLSCSTAKFDAPQDSFAEVMVKAREKGAVAFLGASRTAYISDFGFSLSKAISQEHIFKTGDILLYAKMNLISDSPDDLDLYNLLGDPALDVYAPRRVRGKCDLVVSSSDISVVPENPRQDHEAVIKVNLRNIGVSPSYGSTLELRVDGRIIATRSIPSLESLQVYTVTVPWRVPMGIGEATIYAAVMPNSIDHDAYPQNNVAFKSVQISLEKEGFPITWDASGVPMAPIIEDLDGDGRGEIILGKISNSKAYIDVLDSNGRFLWRREINMGRTSGWNPYVGPFPAVGDINGDGLKEVAFNSPDGLLYAYGYDGRKIKGFPLRLGRYGGSTPVFADLDGDRAQELLAVSRWGKVHAFKYKEGGPGEMRGWGFKIGKKGGYSISVGDLDGDGSVEVILGYERSDRGSVYAFKADGRPVDGFPMNIDNLRLPLAIGDLDGDGRAEIVGIEDDGVTILGEGEFSSWKTPEFKPIDPTGALLADLDEDGDLEIVVTAGDGYICAFHHDGRSVYGYPIRVIPYPTQPVIADITGDGKDEILVGDGSYGLKAFDFTGAPLPGWKISQEENIFRFMAVGDSDGDGSNEVLFISGEEEIHLLKTMGRFNRRSGWKCYGLNGARDFYYGVRKLLPPPEGLIAEDIPNDRGGKIRLRWNPTGSSLNVRYRIYRSTDRNGRYDLIAEVPGGRGSYVDEGLQDGIRYWYILRCTDSRYISSPTSPVDVIPINNFAPPPPGELRLEGFDGDRINISWSPVPGAVGYKVRYGFKSGDYRRTVDVGSTTSWSLIPIAQINHFIVVSAYDGQGNESLFSKELAVLPRDDDTEPPIFLESEPKKVRANNSFKIKCVIRDKSGIQDGSVYLVWDNDGEIEIDSNTTPMVRVSGDIFETATPIPPQRRGAKFLYCIFAADDDHDMGNEEDRSLGGSNLRHVEVVSGADEIYVYPNPLSEVLNLHYILPDEAQLDVTAFDVSGNPVCKLKRIVRGGEGSVSWGIDLPSGIYIYRLRIRYPNLGGQNEEIFRGKFAVVR